MLEVTSITGKAWRQLKDLKTSVQTQDLHVHTSRSNQIIVLISCKYTYNHLHMVSSQNNLMNQLEVTEKAQKRPICATKSCSWRAGTLLLSFFDTLRLVSVTQSVYSNKNSLPLSYCGRLTKHIQFPRVINHLYIHSFVKYLLSFTECKALPTL